MNKPLVSVFTCVYNRADKIHRVFKSMKAQTYPNIEHVIVDDGSTDNVLPLLEQYKKEVSFPVLVFHKENGGKHSATNVAWDNCHGKYIVQLDSDDELLPDAISTLVSLWDEIPAKDYDKYWCVHGRCRTQFSEDMVGQPYPDGINKLSHEEALKVSESIVCEKIGLMKASVLKDQRYLEPEGVKFLPEGVVWNGLNQKYRTWYSNHIVRIHYVDEGGNLSNPKMSRQTLNNRVWMCRWRLENRSRFKINFFKYAVPYCFGFFLTTDKYRKANPYMIHADLLLYLFQLIMFVPAWLAHFVLKPLIKPF